MASLCRVDSTLHFTPRASHGRYITSDSLNPNPPKTPFRLLKPNRTPHPLQGVSSPLQMSLDDIDDVKIDHGALTVRAASTARLENVFVSCGRGVGTLVAPAGTRAAFQALRKLVQGENWTSAMDANKSVIEGALADLRDVGLFCANGELVGLSEAKTICRKVAKTKSKAVFRAAIAWNRWRRFHARRKFHPSRMRHTIREWEQDEI